jgi:hypothetical protein
MKLGGDEEKRQKDRKRKTEKVLFFNEKSYQKRLRLFSANYAGLSGDAMIFFGKTVII